MADLREAGLRDEVLRAVVGWSSAASKVAAEPKASAEGSMEDPAAAVNKIDRVV
jgi:hypothetical protein